MIVIDCLSVCVCVHVCFNIVRSCRVRYLRNKGTAFSKAVPAREGSGAVEGRPQSLFRLSKSTLAKKNEGLKMHGTAT